MRYSYYDPVKNWHRIRPHLAEVEHVLVRDFNKFTWGRSRKKFQPGQLPHEFESCGWYLDHRGPKPAYWWYVKHAASAWLVNHSLELARRVRPKDQWRILSSSQHSTVYNGHGFAGDAIQFEQSRAGIAKQSADRHQLHRLAAMWAVRRWGLVREQ